MPRLQSPDRSDLLPGVGPDDGEALHLRGVHALQQARLDEAVIFLRQAVEAGAGAPAMVNLGIALAASGAVEEAESVLRSAVERDDGNPQAAYNLGHLLAARGADREAESWLVKAVGLAPSYTRATCELAALLLHDGRAPEARTRLHAALEHDPEHPVVLLHLGLAARALGDHATACRHFLACRAALGPQRELMLGLGGSLQETGRTSPPPMARCCARSLRLPTAASTCARLGCAPCSALPDRDQSRRR